MSIKECLKNDVCNDCFVGTIKNGDEGIHTYFCLKLRKRFNKSIDNRLINVEEKQSPALANIEEILKLEEYKNNPNIVIVLESPSETEMKDKDFRVPAIGRTGMKLFNYFYDIVSKIIDDDCVYNVILMNSVQYQCDYYAKSKKGDNKLCEKEKENVFATIWNQESSSKCFCERIKKYQPKIIINACTSDSVKSKYSGLNLSKKHYGEFNEIQIKGISKQLYNEKNANRSYITLKVLVQLAINKYLLSAGDNSVQCYAVSHPIRWNGYEELKRIEKAE